MKSIAHFPLEERPHKCARVHSAQVSAAGEYDDGMHAFKGPFPIEGDEPEAVRSAIVLYNAGLTQLGLGKYEKARRWFGLASVMLKLSKTAGALALSVRIIHNLGYCYYSLGDSEGAMRCFMTALEFARQAGLEEIDEAAINNCLGALCCNK
jgi:tetratricopeptide (TPR) repeat protein